MLPEQHKKGGVRPSVPTLPPQGPIYAKLNAENFFGIFLCSQLSNDIKSGLIEPINVDVQIQMDQTRQLDREVNFRLLCMPTAHPCSFLQVRNAKKPKTSWSIHQAD